MLVACLGWGSLVRNPGELPVRGSWFVDGPLLPIEFARQSENDRITLVLVPTHPFVRSLWVPLNVSDLRKAREALRKREDIPKKRAEEWISHWDGSQENSDVRRRIELWARALQIDAVVWTGLPPKFKNENGRIPTRDEVVGHLNALAIANRKIAEVYIRMTPRQIDTDYRRHIEAILGWTPTGNI